MTEKLSNSRNKSTKCFFNNSGFCKFRDECRNQHFQDVCENQTCDKKCLSRHPKPCKNREKCKFLLNNICAFSHDAIEKENDGVQEKVRMRVDEISNLKNLLNQNKVENEIKFKSLKEAIEIERKKSDEYDNAKKELQEKNDDLEKMLRKEIKELNVKIVNQQKVIEEMLSKENMNYIKDTDEDVPNIVVKELKGRNVTILKTKTGNNP